MISAPPPPPPESSGIFITFHQTVAVRGRRYAVDMRTVAEIPFIPRAGDMVAPLDGDDFRRVDEVFWSPRNGFEVYFEEDDGAIMADKFKRFLALGWKEDE